MRAIYAAAVIALLAQPVSAADAVRTYSLGCTNSSDQQWTETVGGINRMFGDMGRFAFSRPDSTVTVSGREDVQRHVAAMTEPLKNTCHEATVAYRFYTLPADIDAVALFAALVGAGAVAVPPGSGVLTVPIDARASVLAKIAALPGAGLVFSGQTSLLNYRTATLTQGGPDTAGNGGGAVGNVALSLMMQGDEIMLDTEEDVRRPTNAGVRVYQVGNHLRMHSGDAHLAFGRHEDAASLSVVMVDRSR